MFRKTIYIFLLFLFTGSCADTFSSVKRGLTGAKKDSADEFLVEKKDPLILPPDFENLPSPSDRATALEELSNFEKKLQETAGTSTENESSGSTSTEESILKLSLIHI